MIIAIDAGHGLKTSGKRCLKSIDKNETREWYLNDRIADRLEQLLSDYNCSVLRVDDTTGAKDVSLSNRVKSANNAKANVYISIHHNAGLNGKAGGGTVVYYCSESALRRTQAIKLYNAITAKTNLVGNRSQHVINNGFYVIKNTNMPAFLIENGFMDSVTDTPIILTAQHAEKTAQGILSFLVDEYKLDKKSKDNVVKETVDYWPKYSGKKTTLVDAMKSLGIDSSYANRKKIAIDNGIQGYLGTAEQNIKIYNLLVAGLLKK